jgi:hypothetical protein
MPITLNIEKMSIEEKIQTMESIWEDLCKTADKIISPSWHEKVLHNREESLKKGEAEYIDWNIAKENIKKSIS